MNSNLLALIDDLSNETENIVAERQMELDFISSKIILHLKDNPSLDILVVCTHNSRRSQLGEAWINIFADHYEMSNITAFSGGMEVTAFNIRMVNAIRECGFELEEIEGGENPKYTLNDLSIEGHSMNSKVYNDEMNPQRGFMALMVCGHADENCPIVHGMSYRIPLRYKDPKEFDDTEQESVAYVDKVREIGREMCYLFEQIKLLS